MPAGKFKLYNLAKRYIGNGTHDLDDTTNWRAALFLSTSNCNTLSVGTAIYGDLTNQHANANGYTTLGVALTSVVFTESSGVVTWDCDDATWTAAGGSIVARFVVIYRDATVNGIVRPLLAVALLDTTPADRTATTGNTFTVQMSTSGLFSVAGATSD